MNPGRAGGRRLRGSAAFALICAGLAALNLLLLWLLTTRAGWPYLWACAFNFVVFNLVGYRLNKASSFRLGGRVVWGEVLRWFTVKATSLALNLAAMAALVEYAGLSVLMASLLLSVALAPFNCLAHTLYTVAHRRPAWPGGPLRVLQVSAFFPAHGGGIEVVAAHLARVMVTHEVELAWMAGGPPAEWPAPGALPGVRVLPAGGIDLLERRLGLPAPLWGPRALATLWREVGRAQVVHLHDYLYQPTLMAFCFSRLRRRPVVLTQHVGNIPFASAAASLLLRTLHATLGSWVLRGCAQVVFVGEPVRREFQARMRFARPALLIPNGVDHERFHPPPGEPAAGPLRALFVGRFVEKKGLVLLQQVVAEPGLDWTFVGQGPLSPASWPEPARGVVRLLGPLGPDGVAQAMREADLLVLPSTGEGFPLVVQEALACGTPVLVSQEVAEAFPVRDPRCVFGVELRVQDPASALREALRVRAGEPVALRAARAAATELARQWSWPSCAKAYLGVYRQVLGLDPAPGSPAAPAA